MGDYAAQPGERARVLARPGAKWWKSRRPLRGKGAVSNRKSARVTETLPPKSLEVEPGNEASL